jgi:hypothetical protein
LEWQVVTKDIPAMIAEIKRLTVEQNAVHRQGIDAALAERQDSAKDVVKWTKGASEDDYAYAQPSSDTYVTVSWLDGQWRWSARRVQGCSGDCATEAEARRAAIATARGVR